MKLLLCIIFSLTALVAYSQTNIFPTTGSAGIGTTTPKAKLDVAAYVSDGALSTVLSRQLEGNNVGGGTYLGVKGYGTQNGYERKSFSIEHSFFGQINSSINFHRGNAEADGYITFATNGNTQRMVIAANGNVGIGTTSPSTKLQIVTEGADINANNTSQTIANGLSIMANTGGRWGGLGASLEFVIPANTDGSGPWGQGRIITVAGNQLTGNATGKMVLGTRRMTNKLGTGAQWYYGDDIVIDGTGNVGINTLTPSEKLAVNGTIRAKEIKVDSSPWPDYVFEEDYKMKSLTEIEAFIKTNKHLPGMPNQKQVVEEGVSLGEMNRKLLEKVEELTLHLIEMEKRLSDIEKK